MSTTGSEGETQVLELPESLIPPGDFPEFEEEEELIGWDWEHRH